MTPQRKSLLANTLQGIETYEKQCREAIDGWKGFDVVSAK